MAEVRAALADAAARLATVSDTPRLDAELLLAHALGVERNSLLLDPARFAVPSAYEALIERRIAHEPIAYIVGYRDFWTIRLNVGPGALIPRPDSETLIEAAVEQFAGGDGPHRILDLGTGPGTLLLAALAQWPDATGVGIDMSATALTYATDNAAALGYADRAHFRLGDWTDDVQDSFDLILSNPPYIAADAVLMPDVAAYEPATALYAGTDGLDDYRRILPAIPALLAADGIAILEVGAEQAVTVQQLASDCGMVTRTKSDLGGHIRAIICRKR